ncbi:hypothetical protein H4Q26_002246 [Puccinia striiformis f. sp. tritici PST-130]|nr:hypothetical protein H4Q26_002246 [Puccinia striiformis f. sp. tritici PST-130]
MGAHLRNGRNISEEQQRRELELQSRYPISPAAAERIRRIRAQSAASTRLREDILQAGSDRLESGSIPQRCEHVGDLTSASIQRFDPSASSYRQASVEPLPVYGTAVNPYPDHREQTDDPRVTQTNAETHQETPVTTTEEEEYVPPSETAKSMLDHQWLLFERARQAGNEPLMRTAINQAISTQELLTSLVGHEEMIRLSVGWSAQEELTFLETSRREATNRTTPMPVQSQVVPMEVLTPHIPTANPHTSVQPHQFQRGNNPTNNPSRAPRTRRQTPDITFLGCTHSVTREPLLPPHPPQIQPPTLHQVYQEQPVIIRPAMHPQTYANPAYQPPINQQPYYPQHPHPYAPHPQPHGQGRGRGWRRTDPSMRMVRMGASFERVERALGRMNRIRGRGRGGRNPPYPQYQNQAHPQ